MRVHHFGYMVKDLEKTGELLVHLGFSPQSGRIFDAVRQIHLRFYEKDGALIELISPASGESRYASMLSTRRNMIYHICYESSHVAEDVEKLRAAGFRPAEDAGKAVGLGGRKAIFLFHPHMGVIELVPTWEETYSSLAERIDVGRCILYEDIREQIPEEDWGAFVRALSARTGKRPALIYGNCHISVLSQFLMRSASFRERYYLITLPPVFDMDRLGIGGIPASLLGAIELFLYQNIGKENIYGPQWATDRFVEKTTPECVRVSFPNTVFYGYFPQEGGRHDTIIKNQVNMVPMFCGDNFIDEAYRRTGSIRETIRMLRDENAVGEELVTKNLRKAFRMLELQDYGCSISMRDYVQSHYRERYLFTEPKHPCNMFFYEMANRILGYLGLEEDVLRDGYEEQYTLSTINRLLYPAVIRHLGLEFTVSDYYIDRRLTEQRFSFEEFIEVYIRNTTELG